MVFDSVADEDDPRCLIAAFDSVMTATVPRGARSVGMSAGRPSLAHGLADGAPTSYQPRWSRLKL